mgnify:CR=1 FL=1
MNGSSLTWNAVMNNVFDRVPKSCYSDHTKEKFKSHYINHNIKLITRAYTKINFLKNNIDKIDWNYLSFNPNAIELLEENPDKINWNNLSYNSNAVKLLKDNQDKIEWIYFSLNTAIFTYNYEKIKNNNKELNEEIIIKALHPKRMLRLMEKYGEDEIYKNYFDDD